MQNGDYVARSRAFEVLITLCGRVVEKSTRAVGEKGLRLYLRVYRLTEYVIEGEAEDERAQIVDAGDAAKVSEGIFGVEAHLVAALIDRGLPIPRSKTPK